MTHTEIKELIEGKLPSIEADLTALASNLPKLRERIAAKQILKKIVSEVRTAAFSCLPDDCKDWDIGDTEVEVTSYQPDKQGTIDLLFLNHSKKTFKVTDWKRVG